MSERASMQASERPKMRRAWTGAKGQTRVKEPASRLQANRTGEPPLVFEPRLDWRAEQLRGRIVLLGVRGLVHLHHPRLNLTPATQPVH